MKNGLKFWKGTCIVFCFYTGVSSAKYCAEYCKSDVGNLEPWKENADKTFYACPHQVKKERSLLSVDNEKMQDVKRREAAAQGRDCSGLFNSRKVRWIHPKMKCIGKKGQKKTGPICCEKSDDSESYAGRRAAENTYYCKM